VSSHKIYRVSDFAIIGDYTLRIRFDDATEQVIDFAPVLYGPVFGPLRDPAVFNQVRLVEYAGCLEWPTGADFDPETLHDWPRVKDEIIQRRQVWALVDA
jgi:tRNA U34 5-methylaminomethyl-2-thiouridine-forming methyltransferase MnmC